MVSKLTIDELCKKEYNTLTLPNLTQDSIDVTFININDINYKTDLDNENHMQINLPFARSELYSCKLINAKLLAKIDDAKPVYEIVFDISNFSDIKYSPGDTIGILPINRNEEIQLIINKLGYGDICDKKFLITAKASTKKQSKLPLFLPKTVTTIRMLLEHTLELRCLLKKTFIRSLAEYTTDANEKLFLNILCSKEGAKDYTEVILNKKTNILDLLDNINTCRPPFNVLLQNMTRLCPRPYSIANSQLFDTNTLKIIFSISDNEGRKPLTTTMLEECIGKFLNKSKDKIEIQLYFRASNTFIYDTDKIQDNLIMIGTGTGVSPFLSFLEHRAALKIKSDNLGTAVLFSGHRYNGNNIYKNELNVYLNEGVLQHVCTSFSRENGSVTTKYVQEELIEKSKLIVNLLIKQKLKTFIYVCSANKSMSQTIEKTFIDVLVKEEIYNKDEAEKFLVNIKNRGQYLEDVWF